MLLFVEIVSVITSDGRNIVVWVRLYCKLLQWIIFEKYSQGSLKGFDQTTNIILEQSHERVFSEDKGVIQNVLGLYIIRGDNMLVLL
jgi:hypothetical protein